MCCVMLCYLSPSALPQPDLFPHDEPIALHRNLTITSANFRRDGYSLLEVCWCWGDEEGRGKRGATAGCVLVVGS